MRVVMLFLSAIMLVAVTLSPANADSRYGKQKVVYHINYEGGDKDKKY